MSGHGSNCFSTTKKGEIPELKDDLNSQYKDDRVERVDNLTKLLQTKMADGTPVQAHLIKMLEYIDKLEQLGVVLSNELYTDIILRSLSSTFSQFITNFYINQTECSFEKLFNMLSEFEKSRAIVLARSASPAKTSRNVKQSVIKPNGGVKKVKAKKDELAKGECFHCHVSGHWKRNCNVYLESLKKKRHGDGSSSSAEGETVKMLHGVIH